ncbi:glycosidase [Halobacteroides halobius DSM 5150]|uniref:Glycosidase n=1 Tax=Halobacteroides halobius (strain ATCC 35273 / DSM 5150 / MD-1) TaxID=748449 RepID=L0K7D3_HALHC|nr:alpha-amylase family glycosyl hydrolase [Halobacteroides halobius]AGB40450.1 glycosidase [Halobacteroides halobius DSM 5150]
MKKKILIFILLFWVVSLPVYSFSNGPIVKQKASEEKYSHLQVSSPDWRDQVIYFILTDRFNDGNPDNNNQGVGEYNPNHKDFYSGGDLQGIIDKINYIKNLGATAIWITPPVANQWWDPWVQVTGYHGYWGRHFKKVDEHYGTLDTYKKLSNILHKNGMYLIQDIVPNHTGNFFTYKDDKYNPYKPGENFILNKKSEPVSKPVQYPFNMNNYNNQKDRKANIYHWTPKIKDYKNKKQEKNYQISDLDDLNTSNPAVRDALRDSYGYWIEEVGVDGFRVDTVKFIEHEFWNDFFYADDAEAPGIMKVAKKNKKDDFLAFGEVFEASDPLSKEGDKKVTRYLGTKDKPELPAVLNFPLHVTLRRVFAQGRPTHHLSYRLNVTMNEYRNPYITPLFIDNHDVARFLEKGSRKAMKQSLMFMFTIPGIPIVYYGTEQGFTEQRGSMFAEGFGSGGKNHFNQQANLYQYIKKLAETRTSNRILTRGTIDVLQDNHSGSGVFAYKREYKKKTALVLFNTADHPVLMSNLGTGLKEGTRLKTLVQMNESDEVVVGENGEITTELAPRAGLVLLSTEKKRDIATTDSKIDVQTTINNETFTDDIKLQGKVKGDIEQLRVVVDGNLAQATDVVVGADGNWNVNLPIKEFGLGKNQHSLAVYAADKGIVSERFTFTTKVSSQSSSLIVKDPAGDIHGPKGEYTLPQDKSFGSQMDIRQVKATLVGGNLKLNLKMAEITDTWNPDNGFDHVVFNIFIDLPNESGAKVLPRLNATAPEGFKWDYQAFVDGWNNAYYSAERATKDKYGKSIIPAPKVKVNKSKKTIEFKFKSDSFAGLGNLVGVKVYITTWDFDGSQGILRPLTSKGGPWSFGGGNGDTDPLIADDTKMITIDSVDYNKQAIDKAEQEKLEVNGDIALEVGDSIELTVNKEGVIWKSSNEEIAKVTTNGKVKGIKPGKTTITVSLKGETVIKTIKVKEKAEINQAYLLGTATSWKFNKFTAMKQVADGVYEAKIKAPAPVKKDWVPEGKNQAFKIGTNGAWPSDGGGPAFIGKDGKLKEDTGMGNIYLNLEEGTEYIVRVNLKEMTYSIEQVK